MKIKKYSTEAQWLEGRRGVISGSKLHDIYARGNTKKIGFYKLLADHLAFDDGTEYGRENGKANEKEAVEKLGEATGIKFIHSDLETWVSDDNPSMGYSPDAYTKDFKVVGEVKNLAPERHLEIIITNKIPMDYYEQCIQCFIVSPKTEKIYFGSYNKNLKSRPLHYIVLDRTECEAHIKMYMDYELDTLEQINHWLEELAF